MKNSFIVYHDQAEIFNELSDGEAGKLIKAMIKYSKDGDAGDLPTSIKLVFIPIRQQLDRNRDNYDRVSQINSENAKKRWSKSGENATASETMRPHPKAYDKDTDKDTDIKLHSVESEKPTPKVVSVKHSSLKGSQNPTVPAGRPAGVSLVRWLAAYELAQKRPDIKNPQSPLLLAKIAREDFGDLPDSMLIELRRKNVKHTTG